MRTSSSLPRTKSATLSWPTPPTSAIPPPPIIPHPCNGPINPMTQRIPRCPGSRGLPPPPPSPHQVGKLRLPAEAGDCARANMARRSVAGGINRSARARRVAAVAAPRCAVKGASTRSVASCRSGTGSRAGCRFCPFPTRWGQ